MPTTNQIAAGVLDVPLHRELGLRFIDEDAPERGIELEVTGLAENNVGILHGGVAAALLDVAAYLAVVPTLGEGTNAVTHASSYTQFRAVESGKRVSFRGSVVRRTRSLVFCSSEGTCDGEPFASAQVTKSVISA